MSKGKLLVHHKNIQIDLLINYVNVVLQNVVRLNFILQYHIDEIQAQYTQSAYKSVPRFRLTIQID